MKSPTHIPLSVLLATTALVSACQSTPETLAPANISTMTAAQLEEVRDIVAGAVGQPDVRISAHAFASTHILTLEPSIRRTPQGTVAAGSTITRPPTFHLLGDGRRCVLHDLSRDLYHTLSFACDTAP